MYNTPGSLQGFAEGYPEAAAGYAPPQTAYDQTAPYLVALKALSYVAYVNGASYPREEAYLKVAEDAYALGKRDGRTELEGDIKRSVPQQKTIHDIIEDFAVALMEHGFEAPTKLTFSPDGLRKINQEFGVAPKGSVK